MSLVPVYDPLLRKTRVQDVTVVSADIDHALIKNRGETPHTGLDSHVESESNPHTVTHAQAGGQTANDHHNQAHDLAGADHNEDTLAHLNDKVSDGTLDDSGDPRDPNAHKDTHVDGTDDIRDATNALKGLATAAQITAIEAAGDGMTNAQIFLYRTDSYNIANTNTWYDLPFNIAATVKNNATHDHTSNPEQITLTEAGAYEITYNLIGYVGGSASGVINARVLDDGTEIPGSYSPEVRSWAQPWSCTCQCYVGANSVIELQVGTEGGGYDIANHDFANMPDPTTRQCASISIKKISDDTSL